MIIIKGYSYDEKCLSKIEMNNILWEKSLSLILTYKSLCVCSDANPLHYYALRVPRKADKWLWVWSIF